MPDVLRGSLDRAIGVVLEQGVLDRQVRRDRLGDRERALRVLSVELLARLPDGGRAADQPGQQDDHELEDKDLIGEREPGFHLELTSRG